MTSSKHKNWKELLCDQLENGCPLEQRVTLDGSLTNGYPRYIYSSGVISIDNPFERNPELEFLLDVYFDTALLSTIKKLKKYDNIVSLQVIGHYEHHKLVYFDEWMRYLAQIPRIRYYEITLQSYPAPIQIPVGFPHLELLIIEAHLHELPLGIERCKKLLYCNLRSVDFDQLGSDGFDRLKPCQQLRYLEIRFAKLQVFPEALTELSALEELNLEHNEIESLPSSIGNMSALKDLNLSANDLKEIPQELGNIKNLQILDLCVNSILKLPESMMKLQQLEVLELYLNELSQLPEWICELSRLKKLSLYQNKIADIPWDVSKLKQLTDLEELDLVGNPLNEDCKRRLREVFPLDGPVRVTLDETDYAYYRNKA